MVNQNCYEKNYFTYYFKLQQYFKDVRCVIINQIFNLSNFNYRKNMTLPITKRANGRTRTPNIPRSVENHLHRNNFPPFHFPPSNRIGFQEACNLCAPARTLSLFIILYKD
jgi:hypothetical protein